MLADLVRRGGDRKSDCPEGSLTDIPDGITQKQSSRWQQLAEVSEESFERYESCAYAASGYVFSASYPSGGFPGWPTFGSPS